MSIVVKKANGRKYVFTKGADSSMLQFSDGVNNNKIV